MEANSLFDYGKHTNVGCSWLSLDGAGRRAGLGHPMAETCIALSCLPVSGPGPRCGMLDGQLCGGLQLRSFVRCRFWKHEEFQHSHKLCLTGSKVQWLSCTYLGMAGGFRAEKRSLSIFA